MLDISLSKLIVLLGLVAILAELFIGIQTGFDLVVIGTILVASGLLGDFFQNLTITLIVAIALSVVYLAFFRSFIKRKIISGTSKLNTDRLIGETATVTKAISAKSPGQVDVDGELWRATAKSSFKKGDTVQVLSFHGVTMRVAKPSTK